MHAFPHLVALTAPLFLLVLGGYALMRWGRWPAPVADALTRFVFSVAVPALLFRMMSGFSRLPPVDARLLIAYFGGCAIVFAAGRVVASSMFRMDGAGQSIFAVGGVFSNTVLLGVPLAQVLLGDASMPTISLVVVFNALILWTLVTASVEWARNGALSWPALGETAVEVVKNPVIGSILAGTAFGYSGIVLPGVVDRTLELVALAAAPLSLIALGMGLAEFRVRDGWRASVTVAALKLAILPLVVFALARLLGLPPLETQATVLLASLPIGANVYLMARQFASQEGIVAASLVISTALAALTTPVLMALAAS
jgi:predicted permease